jgi:hypothetical protein
MMLNALTDNHGNICISLAVRTIFCVYVVKTCYCEQGCYSLVYFANLIRREVLKCHIPTSVNSYLRIFRFFFLMHNVTYASGGIFVYP